MPKRLIVLPGMNNPIEVEDANDEAPSAGGIGTESPSAEVHDEPISDGAWTSDEPAHGDASGVAEADRSG